MISKKYYLSGLPSVSHIHFLSLTLCLNLRAFPLYVNFPSLKINGSESVGSHWFRISFPKECFSRSTGFLCLNAWAVQGKHAEWFDHLGHSAELCLAISRSSDPQNYKSFNIRLYIRSLIDSEVKAVCCTEKTS